ncbi:hypothetical protein B0H17DRAFT_1083948 [Mycena rosella]|uniref:Uncharacterized protein n=1 Tax=Mycena rosella TaxID=1033263 RepID=A0AAD7GAK1_MYCRO|nr:hypothetical protein B0H17DRAFT_1083948 [Mycena rosella]
MATAIRVRFQGFPSSYVATRWQIPNYRREFEAIPENSSCVFIPRTGSIFRNSKGDKRPLELSFDDTRKWGFSDPDDTELIFARAQSADGSELFCLRMVLNAQHSTTNTHSNTFRVFTKLVKDAKFHSTHLVEAEGSFVPIHYGMWIMDTGEWAGKVLFSITQWCGISWNALSRTKMNTEVNRILIGRTFEALHDFGIDHGGLPSPYDLRHVLIDVHAPGLSRSDLLDGKAPCYIVDFSEARANHECTRKLPILPTDMFLRDAQVGCVEITDALRMLKFMRTVSNRTPGSVAIPTAKALEWHAQYSRLYPDAQNVHVLVAQRAKLYHSMPPVYPDLYTSFESDELYARATIGPLNTNSDQGTQAEEGVDGSPAESILVNMVRVTRLDDPVAV